MISEKTFWYPSAVRLCLLLMLLAGCVREQRQHIAWEKFLDTNKPGVVGPLAFDRNDILVETVLEGDLARGELLLSMRIWNRRSDEIVLDLPNCYLSIDDGREAIPDLQGQVGTAIIKPGESAEYKLSYHPVNAVSFYERTDYRGDIKKKYSLRINFIKDRTGTLLLEDVAQFEFSDAFYAAYLNTAREKNMRIFDFAFEADDFVYAQEKHLDKIFPDAGGAHEIFAITPALTIDRTIINFRTFSEGDTLTIDMRMLNQSSHAFDIVTSRCAIKMSGKVFKPCKMYSDSFSGKAIDDVYVFKPGTRLHLNLKYCGASGRNPWKLAADWIFVHSPNPEKAKPKVPFLYSDILFIESPITRKEL